MARGTIECSFLPSVSLPLLPLEDDLALIPLHITPFQPECSSGRESDSLYSPCHIGTAVQSPQTQTEMNCALKNAPLQCGKDGYLMANDLLVLIKLDADTMAFAS